MKPPEFEKRMKAAAGMIAGPKDLLADVGLLGEAGVKRRARVDTGTMRRAVTSRVDGNAVWIGDAVSYAEFWELEKYQRADRFMTYGIQDQIPPIDRKLADYGGKVISKVVNG